MNDRIKPTKAARSALSSKVPSSEPVKVTAMADVGADGNYARRWVFLTPKRLLIIEADGEIAFEKMVSNIESIEVREFAGSGLLVVENGDDRILEVARFTKTQSKDFLKIAKYAVEILRANGNVNGNGHGAKGEGNGLQAAEENGEAEAKESRCPKCGRALPEWTNVCPHCVEKRKVFMRLLSYVKPYWAVAAVSLGLTVAVTLLALVPPWLLKKLIDFLADGVGTTSVLTIIPIGLLGVYAAMEASSAVRTYAMGWLGEKIIFDIRTQVYRYLQMLSLSFYDRRRTGELMGRVTNDSANVRQFLVYGSQQLIVDVVMMVAIGFLLFTRNWRLAAISLLPVPVLMVGTVIFARKIHGIYHRIWRTWAKLNSVLADTIPGILVVKAFAQEDREVGKFHYSNSELMEADMRSYKLRAMFFPGIGLLMYLGAVFVYWRGGYLVYGSTFTLGDLTLFISYLWMFYGPVQRLSSVTDQVEVAATAAERIFEVLDSRPDVVDARDAINPAEIKGEIVLENVSFSYNPEKTVLKNINLRIEPGQMVGLAGPSGSGKTTLAKLISRFYDPDEGRILVDGNDLRRIKQRPFRERIGVVLQEPFLFHGSIAENIGYGRPSASREEIIEAAKAANAHEFILRLPNGYDTEVGERGTRLSGGEKQRISIARAIINKPSIIILDEATSSVDTITERMIQEALERLVQGKTTIAIAHRLSTLRNADKLVILEEGEIVEEGSHEELLQKENGVYANLVKMQTEMARVRAV
jgi:ATP-binding cassette subfamily B protein